MSIYRKEGNQFIPITLFNGKSAYQIALENGFTGTEQEWLESLKGDTGPAGPPPSLDNVANIIIDDTTTSANTTWSSEKISTQMQSIVAPTQEQVNSAINSYLTENPITGNSGLSANAINQLVTILRNAFYLENFDSNTEINTLATLLTTTGGGVEVTNYNVTNNLTNVVTSNSNILVAENSNYIANLTAIEGYILDSVVVTMGDIDITSTSYLDGVINIETVTGDIVITANAIVEVLQNVELDYEAYNVNLTYQNETIPKIDFRNITIFDTYSNLYVIAKVTGDYYASGASLNTSPYYSYGGASGNLGSGYFTNREITIDNQKYGIYTLDCAKIKELYENGKNEYSSVVTFICGNGYAKFAGWGKVLVVDPTEDIIRNLQ